jgi:hypothetical protein
MAEGAGNMAPDTEKAAPGRWRWWPEWVTYAAAAWTFVFAATSFYWAGGGTVGTQRRRIASGSWPWYVLRGSSRCCGARRPEGRRQADRPRARPISRWMLPGAAWSAGALLSLYGGANLGVY